MKMPSTGIISPGCKELVKSCCIENLGTYLEVQNISNQNIVNIDHERLSRADNLDLTVILLCIKTDESPLLLPIIQTSNQDHNNNRNTDSRTLNPVDWLRCSRFVRDSKGLV